MNLWKERLWSVIENAGLLPPIAWKLDIAKQEEIDRKVAEEEAKWESEFDVIDDYEPTDDDLLLCSISSSGIREASVTLRKQKFTIFETFP